MKGAHDLYNLVQGLRGERVDALLDQLLRSERIDPAERGRVQAEALASLLEYAVREVPFYRDHFSGKQGPFQIRDFPIMGKNELRENAGRLIAEGFTGRAGFVATSGSSGHPLKVCRSRESTARSRAAMYRGHSWYGLAIGDREARIWGSAVTALASLKERLKDVLMNRFRLSAYTLTGPDFDRFVAAVRTRRPKYLFGYPSLLYRFAQHVKENGLDGRSLGFHAVKTTSETLYPHQAALLTEVFGVPIMDEYGCTECGILAFRCPEGGYHAATENVWIEILDADGESCGPDEVGEVVVTDLHNYAAPLIRYRLGDLCAFRSGECTCGRTLPLLHNPTGRSSHFIRAADKSCHGILLYYIMCEAVESGKSIPEFRAEQSKVGEITFATTRTLTGDEARFIERRLKQVLGEDFVIHFETRNVLERNQVSGKIMDFVSTL